MSDTTFAVEFRAFSFATKAEAKAFEEKLQVSFCAMPEADGVAAVSRVVKVANDDAEGVSFPQEADGDFNTVKKADVSKLRSEMAEKFGIGQGRLTVIDDPKISSECPAHVNIAVDAFARLRVAFAQANARIEQLEKLDSEAATYVESVIAMRTHFTGEPPYVGWKGLGLALNEALDAKEKVEAKLSAMTYERDVWREKHDHMVKCARNERDRAERAEAAVVHARNMDQKEYAGLVALEKHRADQAETGIAILKSKMDTFMQVFTSMVTSIENLKAEISKLQVLQEINQNVEEKQFNGIKPGIRFVFASGETIDEMRETFLKSEEGQSLYAQGDVKLAWVNEGDAVNTLFSPPPSPLPEDAVPQVDQKQDLPAKLADACLWYRHDFGLLDKETREKVLFQASEWLSAFDKAGLIPDAPASTEATPRQIWKEAVGHIAHKVSGWRNDVPMTGEECAMGIRNLAMPEGFLSKTTSMR